MTSNGAAGFLTQLNQLLASQQPLMGDQFASMLESQKECAVRAIRQHKISLEQATEICNLIRMNLSMKEIANIRNTSVGAIRTSRYRIRKKMNIPKGKELEMVIQNIRN